MSEPQVEPNRRRWVLGLTLSLLAFVTVVQGTYYQYESKKTSTCQAQYNSDFTQVLKKRAQWADDDKRALNKMLSDILGATKPGSGRQILVDYISATQRTDKLRAENPLPELIDRDC